MSPKAVHQMDLEMGTNGATCDDSQKGNVYLSSKKLLQVGVGIISLSGLWLFSNQRRRRLDCLAEKNWCCTGVCGKPCDLKTDWEEDEARYGTCGLRYTIPCDWDCGECECSKACLRENALAFGVLGCRWSAAVCRNEGCCDYCTPEVPTSTTTAEEAGGQRSEESGEKEQPEKESPVDIQKDSKSEGQCACKHPCGFTCFGTTFTDALCCCGCFNGCRGGKDAKMANYKENCFLFDLACMGFGISCGVIRGFWDVCDDFCCWGECCEDDMCGCKKCWTTCCKPCTGKKHNPEQEWECCGKKLRTREKTPEQDNKEN